MTGLVLALALVQADSLPAHVRAARLEEAGQPSAARQLLVDAVHRDSTYQEAWQALGRSLLNEAVAARLDPRAQAVASGHATTAGVLLDSADQAFTRADALGEPNAAGYRVFVWGERALAAWGDSGIAAAQRTVPALPLDVRPPAILDELAENILRACPSEGVLVTAREEDSYATLYLRLVRGLRSDVYIVPFASWLADSAFQQAVASDIGIPPMEDMDWLEAVGKRRPVCATVWFDQPPPAGALRWVPHSLLWTTGQADDQDAVAEGEFVFVALLDAVSAASTRWAAAAVDFYRHAVRVNRKLCDGIRVYGVDVRRLGCPG